MACPEPLDSREVLLIHQRHDAHSSRLKHICDQIWCDWKLLRAIGGLPWIKGMSKTPRESICILLAIVEQLGQLPPRLPPPSSIMVRYQIDQVMRTSLRVFA